MSDPERKRSRPHRRGAVDSEQRAAQQALGLAVRGLRERSGVAQEELAHRADIDRSYLSGIERGERNISYFTILRVARGLGVSAARLVRDAERIARG